ncbi:hypothetical protein PFMC_05916 [Plasmodium falciparum CAMP/Malaysia]|uniref:Uncharacterized protein n=1 Tax=Plasmodium falciparum (isolate Camp / Malaysia) TaxID=5835 RepID=A0A024WYN6_PLAFC|nr:hypothetical protein PFMC_05916 [Plasmodium falciparum CAMP/Malaysia]
MKLYKNFIKKLRRPPPGNSVARSVTFLRKLSASGVEPTFSQGKITYLTTGLLRQLNVSTNIKYRQTRPNSLLYDLGRFHGFFINNASKV